MTPAHARELVRRAVRTATIELPELFAPGARLLVGFSGGQDSTTLLHALAHAHRRLNLLAGHVDHALRPDSAASARQVAQLAEQIGVPCEVRRVDVAAYRAETKGWSVQQAARAARYQALAGLAEQHQADALLVAHTADDQAETLLLNLTRGTGLQGLAGMRLDDVLDIRRLGPPLSTNGPVQSTPRVVRPLLRVTRSTTLAYCSHFGLPFVDDASNRSRAFTRNRMRLDVLPLLEQINPAIRRVLARTAELAADDVAALDAIVAQLLPRVATDQTYDRAKFDAQPRALQRRLLRLGVQSLVGGLVDVADAPIEDALDLLRTAIRNRQPNQTYHLPYGIELCIGSEAFVLRLDGRARQRERRKTWEVE